MAPEACSVVQALVGHAAAQRQEELAQVFRDAFDPRLPRGYAEGQYVVWRDELRFPAAPGGSPLVVTFGEFERLLNRGLGFLARLFQITNEHVHLYDEPRTLSGSLGGGPTAAWTVRYDPLAGALTIVELAVDRDPPAN
jgi:hypothetical protein